MRMKRTIALAHVADSPPEAAGCENAQRHLNVVKRLEHRRRDPRVPNVQRDGPLVVAAGLGQVRLEASLGDPFRRLCWLHRQAWSFRSGAR
jgi:hypothetical protein